MCVYTLLCLSQGVWNRILDRDAEALRRVGILLRFFGQRGFLQSADWVPHTAEVLTMAQGVFGSAFPSPAGDEVLYTLVNRRPTALTTAHLLPEERHPTRSHSSSGSSRRAAAIQQPQQRLSHRHRRPRRLAPLSRATRLAMARSLGPHALRLHRRRRGPWRSAGAGVSQLWNEHNPEDPLMEDGLWGPATAAAVERSPAAGFPVKA